MNRFSSRKFLLTVLVVVSASILVWFRRVDGGVYSAVVIAAVGGYLTANVTQKRLTDTAAKAASTAA